jgi:hypothetical protein
VAPLESTTRLCLVESETIYGSSSREPDATAVVRESAVTRLPRKYDDAFEESPATQSVKAGETVTRWSLRALVCDQDAVVSYRDVATTKP